MWLGYLPSLGLSLLINKIRVKIKETTCPSLPGTSLILVSILLVYLVDSPTSLSKMSCWTINDMVTLLIAVFSMHGYQKDSVHVLALRIVPVLASIIPVYIWTPYGDGALSSWNSFPGWYVWGMRLRKQVEDLLCPSSLQAQGKTALEWLLCSGPPGKACVLL